MSCYERGRTPTTGPGVHGGTSRPPTGDPIPMGPSSGPPASGSVPAPGTVTASSPDRISVIVSRVISSRDTPLPAQQEAWSTPLCCPAVRRFPAVRQPPADRTPPTTTPSPPPRPRPGTRRSAVRPRTATAHSITSSPQKSRTHWQPALSRNWSVAGFLARYTHRWRHLLAEHRGEAGIVQLSQAYQDCTGIEFEALAAAAGYLWMVTASDRFVVEPGEPTILNTSGRSHRPEVMPRSSHPQVSRAAAPGAERSPPPGPPHWARSTGRGAPCPRSSTHPLRPAWGGAGG